MNCDELFSDNWEYTINNGANNSQSHRQRQEQSGAVRRRMDNTSTYRRNITTYQYADSGQAQQPQQRSTEQTSNEPPLEFVRCR